MGKRSDFPKIDKDAYQTIDKRAVTALLPFLPPFTAFAEPCCGEGHLILDLVNAGHECVSWSDINAEVWSEHWRPGFISIGNERKDALTLTSQDLNDAEMIITNPPWSRHILHPMIQHLSSLKPTWLLFDADWMHTKQSSELIKDLCTDIVSVGRLIWLPGTTMSGKDNCAWYKFDTDKNMDTRFHGR